MTSFSVHTFISKNRWHVSPQGLHVLNFHLKLFQNLVNYTTTKVLDPLNKEAFLNELLSCSLLIYDITLDDEQIHEAEWTVAGKKRVSSLF